MSTAVPDLYAAGQHGLPICEICGDVVQPIAEKVKVQHKTIHKECFHCAICDEPLILGACAVDHALYRYLGPIWFCHNHMMLGSGEKYELLKQKAGARGGGNSSTGGATAAAGGAGTKK